MKIEVCDLCEKRVSKFDSTTVIIKDYNDCTFEDGGIFRAKRKFKGVICDDCLKLLREKAKGDANE